MWVGGVRVIVLDKKNRILMVKQSHPERAVWMVPGGGIEEGEDAREAAAREVLEETGLDVQILGMIWHVEEVSERGQRFVNYFLAKPIGGNLTIGSDPELADEAQVLNEVRYMSRAEIADIENLYPEALREELWQMLDAGIASYDAFRVR